MNKKHICMNYSEIPTMCNGKEMVDIGSVGQTIIVDDGKGNTAGGTAHLFQCPDCKDVALLLP